MTRKPQTSEGGGQLHTRQRRSAQLRIALGLLLLTAALGLWVGGAGGNGDAAGGTGADHWWHEVMAGARADVLLLFSHVLNQVGAGLPGVIVVPLLIAGLLLWRRGWRSMVFALTCFIASALAVQTIKHLVARERPADMLVLSDFGSFPSGHTANAATVAVVLCLMFPRIWIWAAGATWVLLMAFSRTVLAVHWLTDTVGGAALGAAIALLCAAVLLPWSERDGEQEARSSPSHL